MNKRLRILLVPLVWALLLGAVAVTAQADPPDLSNLKLTGLALDPPDPFPDQQGVVLTLTYINQGPDLPDNTRVPYRIEVWSLVGDAMTMTLDSPIFLTDTIKAAGVQLPAEIADAESGESEPAATDTGQEPGGMPTDATRTIKTTITAPPQEGKAEIRVFLPADTKTPMVLGMEVESALPPQISKLFAVLGIFVAMMAIMSAGTEVVVDSIKFALGMKRKISAMEAYEKLQSEIPGKLAALSGESTATQFREACQGLDKTLDQVASATDSLQAMKQGDLGLAAQKLQEISILAPVDEAAKQELRELKDQAKSAIASEFPTIARRLKLSAETTDNAQKELLATIDAARPLEIVDAVVGHIQKVIQDNEGVWTQAWMQEQADNVADNAQEKVEQGKAVVVQTLQNLGFKTGQIEAALDRGIEAARAKAEEKAAKFFRGTKNLLEAVQGLRKRMGPFREHADRLGTAIAVATVLTAIAFGLFRSGQPRWQLLMFRWLGVAVFAAGVISWIILEIRRFSIHRRKRKAERGVPRIENLEAEPEAEPQGAMMRRVAAVKESVETGLIKLEQFWWEWGVLLLIFGCALFAIGTVTWLQQSIHLFWIAIAGVGLGAVFWAMATEPTKREATITETSLAQELVIQESEHKQEEARRAGALKVVAFVVGLALAHLLRIDALQLLQGMLPNIETINRPLVADLTVGILLTGMAATAGSAFWHDKLDQLQSAKRKAEATAKTVQQVGAQIQSISQKE
jgi:hypothetical protein